MSGPIFLTQTVDLSKNDKKKSKKAKKFAMVQQFRQLKTGYISCGATEFSRIPFH